MKHRRLRGAFLVALCLSALLFFCESNDTQRKLAIYGTVHVYGSLTPPSDYPGSNFIAVIGPKDNVKVLNVVQKPDHMAVKIRLSNGGEGWVFSGESIELYEADCRGADFRNC
jgi:hypothetical protein